MIYPRLLGQKGIVIAYFFYGDNCGHCRGAMKYLEHLQAQYPELEVRSFEVWHNKSNWNLFMRMSEAYGVTRKGVLPAVFIGDRYVIGFRNDQETGEEIKALVERCSIEGCEDPIKKLQGDGETATVTSSTTMRSTYTSPQSTAAGTGQGSLYLFTATIGFLDGLNPCSIWAFCVLLGLLLGAGSRKRMLSVGGTYIFFSGLIYLGFLAAWLEFNLIFPFTQFMKFGIALLVIAIGILSLKDYVTSFKGFSLRIPDSKKTALYGIMRRLVSERNSMPLMIVGVASLAVALNFFELLCTAGLPAAFTRVLATQSLPTQMYYFYMIEYVFFYTINLIFLLILFTLTLTVFRVGETYGRVSKLISGLVMMGVGIIMLLKPELLAFT